MTLPFVPSQIVRHSVCRRPIILERRTAGYALVCRQCGRVVQIDETFPQGPLRLLQLVVSPQGEEQLQPVPP